jgi:hypothetical protein
MALPAGLNRGLGQGVGLQQPAQVGRVVPQAFVMVEVDLALVGVDDGRVGPAGELDEEACGLASVDAGGAMLGRGDAEAAAGLGQGGRIRESCPDRDDVRHGAFPAGGLAPRSAARGGETHDCPERW